MSIVLGDVSDDPVKKIEQFQPLADYLAAHLGEFGFGAGEVTITPTIETMAEKMRSGEIDIYFDSLYPALIVSEKSAAEPILRRWKDGIGEYHTIFFARSDSGIKSLADLQGKMLGLESPESTSGFFLPVVYLLQAGFNPVQKGKETETVAADEIGYVFTDEDENTIQWVASGKVAAGATDSGSFMKIPEESQSELIVLSETKNVARHVVLVAADIDPELRTAIKTLLLNLDDTLEGQEILQTFEETTHFDELPPESGWEQMQDLYQVFQGN
jgi:phosphonate transport system substrate-binding protein